MAISFTDASWRLNFLVDSGLEGEEGDQPYHGPTYGIALADIDGDGWLDLYANHHHVPSAEILYGFGKGDVAVTPVALDLGIEDQHGAVFFDIDQDGDLDLLEAVGADAGTVVDPDAATFWNKVLINEGGQLTAANVARDLGLDYGPGRGRILTPIEIDGKTAIFLGSEAREDEAWPSVIMLQQEDGTFAPWSESMAIANDRFAIGARLTDDAATDIIYANFRSIRITERDGTSVTEAVIDAGEWSDVTEVLVADFNGDLQQDIFVGQGWGRRDKLLVRGEDGTWTDQAWESGIRLWAHTASAVAGDFDNDGDQDIAVLHYVDGVDLAFWVNDGSGTFTLEQILRPELPGKGASLITGDVNNDGVLDLIAATGEGPAIEENAGGYFLFEGEANGNNWLSIALEGTVSETGGLGARVYVRTADGREQMLEQDSGAHQWAQDDTRLHFGLGANDSAEVRVVWADGTEQLLGSVAANQRLTLVEDRDNEGDPGDNEGDPGDNEGDPGDNEGDPGDSDDDGPLTVSLTHGDDRYSSDSGRNETVHALNGSDNIETGSGNDMLIGGGRPDILKGGAGDDTIKGGNGADRLFGGSGSDVLRGDRGSDMFVFRADEIVPGETEFDTIRDFNWRHDTIRLKGFEASSIDELELTFFEDRALIVVDGEQSIWLKNLRDHDDFLAHDLIDFA